MGTMNRREFLGTVGAAAACATGAVRAAEGDRTLKLGIIGCGWYGLVDAKAAFEAGGVEVIGLADVDSAHLEKTAGEIEKLQGKRPKGFKDYREMLEMPGLEVVIIATPPHWHALPFIDACRKGLHIYCEKPLAYDIREGRAMVEAARKAGNVVQIGFQRRQSDAFKAAAAYLREGKAGKIVQVEAQIHYGAGRLDRTPQEPPASLDWEMWCGPAPKLPYSPAVGHHYWRLEKEYGHGHLVDWGIHLIDATRLLLNETAPKRVSANGGLYVMKESITTPDTMTVWYEFETCPVVWRHRIWGAAEYRPEVNNGIFVYGEQATLFVAEDRWTVLPREKGKSPQEHTVSTMPENQKRHMAEFLEAVRAKSKPSMDTEQGHLSAMAVHLAMISYESGTAIEWDAKNERITNSEAANSLLKREYRAPWKHPWQQG